MSDRSAADTTDLVVRLVLEAVDQRLKNLSAQIERVAAQSEQRHEEVVRVATELKRWLTANAKQAPAKS